jgi:anthocyanidin reductase
VLFLVFCADSPKKISHLVALQSLGELNLFRADLTVEEDFDAPIAGCELVFQLATPVNFASQDPEVKNLMFSSICM